MPKEQAEWWKPTLFRVTCETTLQDSKPMELPGLRDRLAQDQALKQLFLRTRRWNPTSTVIEIPLVLDVEIGKRQNDATDEHEQPQVLFVGHAVSWPAGVAQQIIRGDLQVATAVFELPRGCSPKRPTPAVERRSRRHARLNATILEAHAQGRRQHMEDRYSIHLFKEMVCFGVYDGHAGTGAADLICENLVPYLREELRSRRVVLSEEPLKDSLRETVRRIEETTLVTLKEKGDWSGSTLCVCLLTHSFLIVGHLGDSRVVVSRKGVARQVTTKDHLAKDYDEKLRIHAMGARVDDEGYLEGLLQVSRAIGDVDPDTKQKILGLSSEPDIFLEPIDQEVDEFVIIACDGLWESISAQGAVEHVRKSLKRFKGDLAKATDELVSYALRNDSTDNITAVVAYLKPTENIWMESASSSCTADEDPAEVGRPKFRFKLNVL